MSPSFYPAVAYGGPIFSTRAITDGISQYPDFDVKVLTTDTADPNSNERLILETNPVWFPKGYPVRFCRRRAGVSISTELLRRLPAEIDWADVVHLTGPYNFPVIPTLLLCRSIGKPLVWSPRGGFQATAQWIGAPSRKRKIAFEKLCGLIRPKQMTLHVTAQVEARTSQINLGETRTVLIPNAVDVLDYFSAREWRRNGELRIAFLSRIHPKKGLDILISALTQLPAYVKLDIYGAGDSEYVTSLKDQVSQFSLNDRVLFHGHVDGDAKTHAYTNCDLFCLPTHSENFGIVVAEALAHGTPVITTFNAPWSNLEKEHSGFSVEATVEGIVSAIQRMDSADLKVMGQNAQSWMRREFSTDSMVAKFASLYRSSIDSSL